MFLTPEQRIDLTDARQRQGQIDWLVEHGFQFEIGASGWPKILVAEVERKMLSTEVKRKSRKPDGPNFAAVNAN